MPITVPVIGTEIDVVSFGKPVVDAINGLAPTTWTNVTLLNNWVNDASNPVQYRKSGDMLQLRGRCKNGTNGFTDMFILPVGFRPMKETHLSVAIVISAASWGNSVAFIYVDGRVAGGGSTTATDYSFANSASLT